MDSDIKKLLEDNIELSRENNKMLHKMRRTQKWHGTFAVVKYLVIASLAFGAYYYLQPYIQNLTSSYSDIIKSLGKLGNIKSPF